MDERTTGVINNPYKECIEVLAEWIKEEEEEADLPRSCLDHGYVCVPFARGGKEEEKRKLWKFASRLS